MGRRKKKTNETVVNEVNEVNEVNDNNNNNNLNNSYLYQLNSEDFKFTKESSLQQPIDPVQEPVDPVESVKETIEPVKETVEPVKETVEPVKETVEPVKETVEPVKETVEPVKETVESVKETVEPVKETVESVKETVEPVKETVNILFTHISEGKNIDLNRWICHHLGLGFSHIYILNIGNRLSNNIYYSSDLVTIINTDKPLSLESVMRQSYNFSHKYMFDWMLYIRYNEFLHLSSNLRVFLNDKVKYDQVMISNRSILNMHSINVPNNYSNYYFTFSDMSNSYINNDLKNYIS